MSEITTNPAATIATRTDLTDIEKIKLTAATVATQTVVNPAYTKLFSQINTTASLRYKIDTGTATAADVTKYNQARQDILGTLGNINAAGSMDADAQLAINNELQAAKLKQIAGQPAGSITTANFTDFLDYIFRTQAINPYSRERACDLDFIDMMSNIAADIGDSTIAFRQIPTLIINAVS